MSIFFAESANSTSLVFLAYLLSYLFLGVLLAVTLWMSPALTDKGWTDPFLIAATAPSRWWKFLLVFVLCGMAALPPFYGFVFKVGVLTHLASAGAWGLFTALLVLLFLSWHAYQAMIFRVVNASSAQSAAPRRSYTAPNLLIITLALALGLGFCFIDDFLLFSCWLTF